MKCPVCGNEFPSIIKECPFCATEKARDKYIDIRESYRPNHPDSIDNVPKQGMHWFFALIVCLVMLAGTAAFIVYLLFDVNPESWVESFLLLISAVGIPAFTFYWLWLYLTKKRYGRSLGWRVFCWLQIIGITATVSFCISVSGDYIPSSVEPDLLHLAAFIIVPLLAWAPYRSALKQSADSNLTNLEPTITPEESINKQSIKKPYPIQGQQPITIKTSNKTSIILPICCIIAGIAVGFFAGVSINPIDRSNALKYPIQKKSFDVNVVYINVKKGNVFHESKRCRLEESLLGINKDSFIEISEYEAILRGFERCPSCYEYATSRDVSSIEYEIDDIIDYLK